MDKNQRTLLAQLNEGKRLRNQQISYSNISAFNRKRTLDPVQAQFKYLDIKKKQASIKEESIATQKNWHLKNFATDLRSISTLNRDGLSVRGSMNQI
jgi:hypothetical protein